MMKATTDTDLDSTFICIICFQSDNESLFCRFCSKLICVSCVNDLFKKNAQSGLVRCPNCCNDKMGQKDFITLRWLPDHRERIKEYTNELERIKMNECSQHRKEELSLYCLSCSKAICAQCIGQIFEGKHVNHEYCRIEAAQKRLFEAMDKKANDAKPNLDKMQQCIEKKEFIIDEIQARKNERLGELKEFLDKVEEEIKFEAIQILQTVEDERNELITEMKHYDQRQTNVKQIIESSSQIELFEKEKQLYKLLSQKPEIPKSDNRSLPNDYLLSPLSLPWQTDEYVLEQFSIRRGKNERIISPQIRLDYDQYWSLIIYINETTGYLDVMLKLNKGMTQQIAYKFIFELIHSSGKINRIYALKSKRLFKEGQQIGFKGFYKLDNLSKDGFLDKKTDSIKIRFKLCPLSIFEQHKLLQWQIDAHRKAEQIRIEENKEKRKIEEELTNLKRDYEKKKQIIKDQKIKIDRLTRDNLERKRKRSPSNDKSSSDKQEDLRIKLEESKRHR